MPIRDIVLFAAVTISLPICLIRPAYGILVWTVLGFLNPQAFTYGAAREAPLALAVAIPTLIGFLIVGQYKKLFTAETCLLITLWLWCTVTSLNCTYSPDFADKTISSWFRWGMVSKILLMTVVMVGTMASRARLRLLVLSIGVSFGLLILHALPGMILAGGAYRVYGPENSMIANNNSFGLAVNMAIPFFFYLAKTETKRWLKWALYMAFAIAIPTSFFTYSRGAFVGLVCLGASMFLVSKQRLLIIPVALLALVFGVFLAPQKWRDRIDETMDTREASAASRLNAWAFAWNLAKAYPITGGGFDAFTSPSQFNRYAPNPRDVHGPHSIYLGVLGDHGFVGFILYFSLVGYCFVVLRRILKLARHYGDEQSAGYAHMLRFSLIAFFTTGAFLGVTYFDFYFTIVACTAILKRTCYEEWAADSFAEGQEEGDTSMPLLNHAGA